VQADDGGPGAPPASAAAFAAATAPPEGDPSTARATALPAGASGADVPGRVRSVLRCPARGGAPGGVERALQCTGCGRARPVEGGVPVLIAGGAEAPAAQWALRGGRRAGQAVNGTARTSSESSRCRC